MAKNDAPQAPDNLAASELIGWFDRTKRVFMHNYQVMLESASTLEKAMAKAPMERSAARAKARRVARYIKEAAEAEKAAAVAMAKANRAFQNEFEPVMNPKRRSKTEIEWTK